MNSEHNPDSEFKRRGPGRPRFSGTRHRVDMTFYGHEVELAETATRLAGYTSVRKWCLSVIYVELQKIAKVAAKGAGELGLDQRVEKLKSDDPGASGDLWDTVQFYPKAKRKTLPGVRTPEGLVFPPRRPGGRPKPEKLLYYQNELEKFKKLVNQFGLSEIPENEVPDSLKNYCSMIYKGFYKSDGSVVYRPRRTPGRLTLLEEKKFKERMHEYREAMRSARAKETQVPAPTAKPAPVLDTEFLAKEPTTESPSEVAKVPPAAVPAIEPVAKEKPSVAKPVVKQAPEFEIF